MLRRSIISSVADRTSGRATHRIASQARQGLAMPWQDGGSKLRAVRVAPGRLACEPTDDDYLRELAFHEAGHAVFAGGLKDGTHVGADHNHGALGAKREQSPCHNAPIDAM